MITGFDLEPDIESEDDGRADAAHQLNKAQKVHASSSASTASKGVRDATVAKWQRTYSWLKVLGQEASTGALITVCTLCTKHKSANVWDENTVRFEYGNGNYSIFISDSTCHCHG